MTSFEISFEIDLNEFDDLEREYIGTLTDAERKTLCIAKSQLETSFDLKRANGFVKWMASKK